MSKPLHTLVAPCSYQVEIRKSRFLAQAAAVASPEAAHSFLEHAREDDAGQHCWAYRVGEQYRFHDDHEPSGSAGKPILAAIDGQQLDQVAVLVARWFGGIKLGIGGLMRAYGGTAAECLRQAQSAPLVTRERFVLTCDFRSWDLLQARLRDWQAESEHVEYGAAGVQATASVPQQHMAELKRLLADLTSGQGDLHSLAS